MSSPHFANPIFSTCFVADWSLLSSIISPVKLISPIAIRFLGIGILLYEEIRASITAWSVIGSLTRIPPVMFKYTS